MTWTELTNTQPGFWTCYGEDSLFLWAGRRVDIPLRAVMGFWMPAVAGVETATTTPLLDIQKHLSGRFWVFLGWMHVWAVTVAMLRRPA